jgi:hypothetical protein
MRSRVLLYLAAAVISVGGSARGQRIAAPTDISTKVSGPNVTLFTINGGAATAADRDVTFQILFDGSTALYRVADAVRPVGGWLIASQGTARGALRLTRSPEGSHTVYLEIRKDAVSPVTVKTATITVKYPTQDYTASGEQIFRAEFDYGFGASRKKISTSGDSCYFGGSEMSAWGNFPAAAAMGIPIGPSPETICEIKALLGKNLKAGWTLRSATVKIATGQWGVAPLANARCEVQAAAYGSNVPALTILVKHPGSLSPFDTVATFCTLVRVVFRGPDDPDFVEGLGDIF